MSPRPTELPESGFAPALRLAREGRLDDALDWMERRIGPSDSSEANAGALALVDIGRIAEGAGDLARAERALLHATRLCPRYPDLHHRLGCLQLARHQRAEARRSLERALQLNPRYAAARLDLALLDAREGLIPESLEALRALARDSRVEDAGAFQQGLQRLSRAEWDDAEPLLRRALSVSDPMLRERLERFRERLAAGQPEMALASLEDVLPRHQGYPDLHDLVGLAEMKLGRWDDALASFARALELHPDFHEARVHLAQALEAVGSQDQAAEQVALVLECDPEHASALALERAWAERRRSDRRARRRLGAMRGREADTDRAA